MVTDPGVAFFNSPSGVAIHHRPHGAAGRPARRAGPRPLEPGPGGQPRRRARAGRAGRRSPGRPRAGPSATTSLGGLRRPVGPGFVDASGQPVELAGRRPVPDGHRLEREDELLGVLVHDPAIEAEDPGLVEAVGNAARLALENERLAAEVRAQARGGPGVAGPDRRGRRRRAPPGGAGPPRRGPAAARRARPAAPGGQGTTPGATALLDEATGEQTAIGEVRGLARGVHPTILTETGLRAAVDARRADPAAGHRRHPGETLRPASSRRRPTSSSPRPSRTSPATPTRARPASRRSSTTAGWW